MSICLTTAGCCCHRAVIDEVLMPLWDEYGDKLQIEVVDISDPNGSSGMSAANCELSMRTQRVFAALTTWLLVPVVAA